MSRSHRHRAQVRSDYFVKSPKHSPSSSSRRENDILDIERMGNGSSFDSYAQDILCNPESICMKIFGKSCGSLLKSTTCTWDSGKQHHGRLYITENYICFYSKIHGFETKARLSYPKIEHCKKENSVIFIPDAISLSEVPGRQYVFRGISDRDECFELLKKLIRNSKITGLSEATSLSSSELSSHINDSVCVVPPPRISSNSRPKCRSISMKSISQSPLSSDLAASLDSNGLMRIENFSKNTDIEGRKVLESKNSVSSHSNENQNRADNNVIGRCWHDTSVLTHEVHKIAFEAELLKTGRMENVSTATFQNLTIKEFFEMYICDNSPHSLPDFHRKHGDWEVKYGNWCADSEKSHDGIHRSITFKTPVHIPLGNYPKQVDTVKHQKLRIYGSVGILYESSTHVLTPVPFSDAFFVEDRWVITPLENDKGCHVAISWRCVWIKQAYLLRPVVERQARNDVFRFNKDLLRSMAGYIEASKADKIKDNAERPKQNISEVQIPQTTPHKFNFINKTANLINENQTRTQKFRMYLCQSWHFILASICMYVVFFGLYHYTKGTHTYNPSLKTENFGVLAGKMKPIYALLGENNILLKEVLRNQEMVHDRLFELKNVICDRDDSRMLVLEKMSHLFNEIDALKVKLEEMLQHDGLVMQTVHRDIAQAVYCTNDNDT